MKKRKKVDRSEGDDTKNDDEKEASN